MIMMAILNHYNSTVNNDKAKLTNDHDTTKFTMMIQLSLLYDRYYNLLC